MAVFAQPCVGQRPNRGREQGRLSSTPPAAQSSRLSVLRGLHPSFRAFLFPNDQQIDLELWAQPAEFDSTELHQMRVQDNCVFSISPKAGSLSPGQEQVVELKYRCSSHCLSYTSGSRDPPLHPFPVLLQEPGLALCDSRVP